MASDWIQGSRFLRFAGWLLVVVGGGWLCLLALALVTSDDIGATYVVVEAMVTGPFAIASIILGLLLISEGRGQYIPFVTRVNEPPK